MTVPSTSSDVRRKHSALLLVFTVFAIAFAIDRLPVPAPQPVTPPRAAALPALPESLVLPIPEPIIFALVPPVRSRDRAAVKPVAQEPALPLAPELPIVNEPVTVALESEAPAPLLPSRSLHFDIEVPMVSATQYAQYPPAAFGGGGIGAAGQAVGRAFGVAGRQIVTAFRRTGDAVKGAF